MDSAIEELLKELCIALSDLWELDSFTDFYWTPINSNCAKTIATGEANTLPITNRPIRGYSNVNVRVFEDDNNSLVNRIESLILRSGRPESYYSQETHYKVKKVQHVSERIGHAIDQDPKLSYRLHSLFGYKTFSIDQFLEVKKEDNHSSSIYLFILARFFARELAKNKFNLSKHSEFRKWDTVCKDSLEELEKLKLEENYNYEVCIFLNGPLIDELEDILIANLLFKDKPIEISLGYATDDALKPLVKYEIHPAFEKINTVIKYKVVIPIEAGEEEYLIQYHHASLVAQVLLDSLRLCRPLDDIGVLAIEVLPDSFSAPSIRKTWVSQYQHESAIFEPKRFDFSSASPLPLAEEEVKNVKIVVQLMLSKTGFDQHCSYAMRRFRNSIERYSVNDSERLLEYAIALESLYLNDSDGNRGELTYRLSLRAARFLEAKLEKRKEIFSLINKLYGFRSLIVHGHDVTQMRKTKHQESLKLIFEKIPVIVSESIIRLLAAWEYEPEISKSDFWKRIELED